MQQHATAPAFLYGRWDEGGPFYFGVSNQFKFGSRLSVPAVFTLRRKQEIHILK